MNHWMEEVAISLFHPFFALSGWLSHKKRSSRRNDDII